MKFLKKTPLRYLMPPLYFRYLLARLVQPFFIVLAALSVIWVMVDLYGNLDTFLEKKASIALVLKFYALEIPDMLPVTMPATMLFASLFTLLNLNRRSEFVALESGGISPGKLYLPFFFFSVLMALVLAGDLYSPAPWADLKRDQIILQVRNSGDPNSNPKNLIYLDRSNHRTWFFQELNLAAGTGKGVTITSFNSEGAEEKEYFVKSAQWDAAQCLWVLQNGKIHTFETDSDETFEKMNLDATTPPTQMILVNTPPDQLSLHELGQYINNSAETPLKIAEYKAEWWYRIFYPTSLVVLLLFALAYGTQSGRSSALSGVVGCIVVFLFFFALVQFSRAMGHSGKVDPILSAAWVEVAFAILGVWMVLQKVGWMRELSGNIARMFRRKSRPA